MLIRIVIHAGIAAGVGRAFRRVCLFVCALTGKRLELLTPNLVHVYSIAVDRHPLIQRSKLKVTRLRKPSRSRVASDHVPYSAYQYAAVLPAAVAGVGLRHPAIFQQLEWSHKHGVKTI